MKISESMNLSELAEHMGPEAQPAEAAAMRNILVDVFDGEDAKDIGEVTWRYFATAAVENPQPLPDGLTGDSAHYACDGPRDQVIAELRRILDECVDWGTPEAENMRDECREYLEELES
jgi:hypothetical protein